MQLPPAIFLDHFWSSPIRFVDAFPVDPGELADRGDLGLTNAKVRGAMRVVKARGFLDRTISIDTVRGLFRSAWPAPLSARPTLLQSRSRQAAAELLESLTLC
jgi:hypothetical protein